MSKIRRLKADLLDLEEDNKFLENELSKYRGDIAIAMDVLRQVVWSHNVKLDDTNKPVIKDIAKRHNLALQFVTQQEFKEQMANRVAEAAKS